MLEVDCVQLTDAWWEARQGLPTASDFGKIMTPTKRQASASQEPYIAQLLADITCYSPKYFSQQGGPVNAAVQYGRVTETKARRFYEQEKGIKVREVGFCKTDDGRFGCSPDGLLDPDGGLELKCPERKTHLLWLMKGVVPVEHLCQVHGCLIVSGRKWWDFMSYCEQETPLLIRVVPDSFTMALRVQLELFDVKFQAAKKKYLIRQEQGQEQDTPEILEAMENWRNDLAAVDEEVRSGRLDEEGAVDRVNGWLDDLKRYERSKKRRVYRVLEAWLAKRPSPWHLDSVNLIYRLQENVEF